MPATRTLKVVKVTMPLKGKPIVGSIDEQKSVPDFPMPETLARAQFRTEDGKGVTDHQWAVYDWIMTIPMGKVVTYKDVAAALKTGSPRSVGNALRNNPFAPYVPCHRIIASNRFVGGFCGEWGANSKTGTKYYKKLDLLKSEGVQFDEKGMLVDKNYLWTDL